MMWYFRDPFHLLAFTKPDQLSLCFGAWWSDQDEFFSRVALFETKVHDYFTLIEVIRPKY